MKLKAMITKVETADAYIRITARHYAGSHGVGSVCMDIPGTATAERAYYIGREIEISIKPTRQS